MVLKYVLELTLAEIYHLLSKILFVLIIFFILISLAIKYKSHVKFLKKIINFSEKKHVTGRHMILFLIFILVVLFGIFRYEIYQLDQTSSIKIDEKIVIIELDDYWNIDETAPFFKKYGHTLERYRSVSNIIDKYNFTATLGVTPFIFVEELKENYPLEEDEKMMDYLSELKSKGYELAMHGYNHCRNEFYCPHFEEVWFNIYNGKKELETLFGMPFVTYLPPGNTWTTEQYENIKRAGFVIIGNTHVPKAYSDEEVIITPKGYDPIYYYKWYAQDFRYTSYEVWIEEYENSPLFILQLHPNTFDSQKKLDDLDRFLRFIKEDGARVMTYGDFYNKIREKRNT